MICEFCHSNPCMCGEAYKKLTDFGIAKLLSAISKHKRNIKIDIKIDGTPVDTYVANFGVTQSKGLLEYAMNTTDIPDNYVDFLHPDIGSTVTSLVLEPNLDERQITIFPILAYFYYTGQDVSRRRLRRALLEMWQNNYFADELAEVNIPMIDEMIKCASSDSSYEYRSNIVISHLLTSFKNESINEVGIRNMLHKLTSSLELINKLTACHPTEEDSKSFFQNAFKFMLLGCGLDTKVVSYKWFPNTRLMDELFSCDYALCNAIKQYILVSNWVL